MHLNCGKPWLSPRIVALYWALCQRAPALEIPTASGGGGLGVGESDDGDAKKAVMSVPAG